MEILNKGLKHNLKPPSNSKERIKQLIEIENIVLKTEREHQDEIRTLAINEISKTSIKSKHNHTSEMKVINEFRKKLDNHNAMITKADKGNTAVILYKSEYNTKIDEFISTNNIINLSNDPTQNYLKEINKVISNSIHILNKYQIQTSKMMKPKAPKITGLPKIHKDQIPIRPLINFTTSPTFKIAKVINNWLNQHIFFQNNYSIKNNIELIDKIQSIKIPNGAKLLSFDITNMYSNIPITETLEITTNLLIKNHVDAITTMEAINILKTITNQNYFQHNNKLFSQIDGLAMGNPLSGTLANIYLNHIENTHIINIKNKYMKNIIYWHRYVDDVLILFQGSHRQLDNLHKYINNIHNQIKFTLEIEKNKSINFLDLTIQNINQMHNFKIHRKETQTNHTINQTSYHPPQHKYSAYNHMIYRLNHIPMSEADYMEELKTIKFIATKNGFDDNLIERINRKVKHKIHQRQLTTFYDKLDDNTKYISMEYDEENSKFMNKILKKYGYKLSYKTSNKIQQKLNLTTTTKNNDLDSGVYKLFCNNCPKYYIGQTGRSFAKRFTEHITEIKKANINTIFKSNYAEHMFNEKHTYTDVMNNLLPLHKLPKGNRLDRMEEIEIYKCRNDPNILNNKLNTKTNKIYDLVINLEG